MKINIERLIDAELEEMDSYNEYAYFSIHRFEKYPDNKKRNEKMMVLYRANMEAQWQIRAIMEVLNSTEWKKLYIAARAIKKWRERTNYDYLMSEEMCEAIGKFIFGKEFDNDRSSNWL